MSFNPTEMLQRIRLQNQIQNSQPKQMKNQIPPQYTPIDTNQNQNNNSYNNIHQDQNFIPANPNSAYYLNKQNNRDSSNDYQQMSDSKQGWVRNSQQSQQGENDLNRGKVHIHISQDMIDNERIQVQDYLKQLSANNPSTKLDSELIENLIIKIQKLEGQVFNLTSNLNEANTSVSDLVIKKKELEDELSEQIAKQIEQKQQRQSHNGFKYNKVATFGKMNEQDKNETTYSIVVNNSALVPKDKKQAEFINKSSIQTYDDFQMHSISEQMSEEDEDQKSRRTFAKQSQIVEESVKNFEEEIVQLRLQTSAKMESIGDILRKKGKSPLKTAEKSDLKDEIPKQYYQQKQLLQEDSNRKSFSQLKNVNNANQQPYKENNMSQPFKRRDSELSKSPLSQSQVLNKNQKSQKISYSQNEENLLNSQKFSQKSIKESRVNTSITPTRQIEKPIGRLNLDLLANLVKANPCLNRPILTIKMDDNFLN